MLTQSDNKDERNIIAGVRIDLESRFICIDFKQAAKDKIKKRCLEYLCDTLGQLDTFLTPYDLSFKIVDELPERESIDEEERIDTQKDAPECGEENSKHYIESQIATNVENLMNIYQQKRMIRVDSVKSIFLERGIKND